MKILWGLDVRYNIHELIEDLTKSNCLMKMRPLFGGGEPTIAKNFNELIGFN